MNLTATFKLLIKRKLATAVLITASVAAFATLGDGGKKNVRSNILSAEKSGHKSISLRTSYNYKGNNILTSSRQPKYIVLNTVVTYQKGNATYMLPVKKKVLLDKIKFNPAPPKF